MGTCNGTNNNDNTLEQQGQNVLIDQENEQNNKEDAKIINKHQANVQVNAEFIEQNEGEINHYPSKIEANKLEEIPNIIAPNVQNQLEIFGNYVYKNNPENENTLNNNQPFQIYQINKDQSIYIGQWFEGQRQGQGKQIFKDGSVYEGYWYKNQKQGQGRLINSNGDIYEGEWEHDKPTGAGQYTVQENAAEQARKLTPVTLLAHREGPSAKAKRIESEPDFISIEAKQQMENLGVFHYNRPEFEVQDSHELGPYQMSEEAVYTGFWKNKQRNGRGKEIWKDGSVYYGYWKDDKKSGFGRMIYNNGDVFEGEWVEDKPAQKGTYIHAKGGANYAAQFFNWLMHFFNENRI